LFSLDSSGVRDVGVAGSNPVSGISCGCRKEFAPSPTPDFSGTGNAEKLKGREGFGTAEEGARIILQLATLPADRPSGGLFGYVEGGLPW
jgi:hypothetical protein